MMTSVSRSMRPSLLGAHATAVIITKALQLGNGERKHQSQYCGLAKSQRSSGVGDAPKGVTVASGVSP